MTQEEIERLKKGQQILNDIDACKYMIDDLKEAIEDKESIKSAVMFVSGAHETRVSMTKDAAVDVMQVVLAKYEQELAELQKLFENL